MNLFLDGDAVRILDTLMRLGNVGLSINTHKDEEWEHVSPNQDNGEDISYENYAGVLKVTYCGYWILIRFIQCDEFSRPKNGYAGCLSFSEALKKADEFVMWYDQKPAGIALQN